MSQRKATPVQARTLPLLPVHYLRSPEFGASDGKRPLPSPRRHQWLLSEILLLVTAIAILVAFSGSHAARFFLDLGRVS